MKVSVNAIRDFNKHYHCGPDPAPDGVEKLVERIGAQLAGVEGVDYIGPKYAGIVVVKVVECHKHDNSDHLNICLIDDGGVTPDVARNGDGYVQVVCGAPNVRAGLTVAWLPPSSTVPDSHDKEPFILSVREIRGQVSNGMLASPKELALGDSHDGILEIDEDIAPGTPFADHFRLMDDAIIDMENKMFTHRPDLFGMIGIAREVAGIQGQKFTSPEWYRSDAAISVGGANELHVQVCNDIPELAPRFTVVPMSNISVKPSPVWLQVGLSRLGIRPINNVVDLTNYYMTLTGQPLHAYDYDKVVAQDPDADHATITIRHPKPDEKLLLLNGKTVQPRPEAIMIASATRPIGLGGVMGGGDTEVDDSTTRIILECATFDMYSIRRTSMEHGIFTDAVTRYNKGQSPLQNMAVLAKIVSDVERVVNGIVAGQVIDDNHVPADITELSSLHPDIPLSAGFINARLGLQLPVDQIIGLLTNVEFSVQADAENLSVRAPFWRTDIEIPEDIVEEVGRLYGFDKLPLELPRRDLTPTTKNSEFELQTRLRDNLSRAGANEVLNYSFVHGNLLDKVGQDRKLAYKLSNALSPDLQYFRMSLTPSLLDKVHANSKTGYDEFALFEIGKAHIVGEPAPDEMTVPKEVRALSLVYAAKKAQGGAAYYTAKLFLTHLLDTFSVANMVTAEPLDAADLYENRWLQQMTAPYQPDRSMVLRDDARLIWGVCGEFKPSVTRALKLPAHTAGFEIDPLLFASAEASDIYNALPRFPKVTQDLSLRLPAAVTYQQLHDTVWRALRTELPGDTSATLTPLDIFQRADDVEHKQIAFRLSIVSTERTLNDAEVSKLLDTAAKKAAETLAVERL